MTRRPLGPGYDPDRLAAAEPPRRRGRTVAEQVALAADRPATPAARPTQSWEERQRDLRRIDQVLELLAGEDEQVVMLGQDYRLPTDLPRVGGPEVVFAEADRPRRPLTRRPAPGDQAPSAG